MDENFQLLLALSRSDNYDIDSVAATVSGHAAQSAAVPQQRINICSCGAHMQIHDQVASLECTKCGSIRQIGEESNAFDSRNNSKSGRSSKAETPDYSKIQREAISSYLTECFAKIWTTPADVRTASAPTPQPQSPSDIHAAESPQMADTLRHLAEQNNRQSNICADAPTPRGGKHASGPRVIDFNEVPTSGLIKTEFNGQQLPRTIIPLVIARYMAIIKLELDNIDGNGLYIGKKKFVRRGNVKKEIIGALIYYECIKEGVPFKKKEIAALLCLAKEGISRGEDIIRSLAADQKIVLPRALNVTQDYISRYFTALLAEAAKSNLDARALQWPRAQAFIYDLITDAPKFGLGINMIETTRIIGAIWFLIAIFDAEATIPVIDSLATVVNLTTAIAPTEAILPTTESMLAASIPTTVSIPSASINAITIEKVCHGVKKNTFQKFSTSLAEKIEKFRPLLESYNIKTKKSPKFRHLQPAKVASIHN
jgi:hypothetical protein